MMTATTWRQRRRRRGGKDDDDDDEEKIKTTATIGVEVEEDRFLLLRERHDKREKFFLFEK